MLHKDMRGRLVVSGIREKKFPCNYCDRYFTSVQALGGHQNGHRREREIAKRVEMPEHIYSMQMQMQPQPPPLPPANIASSSRVNYHQEMRRNLQNHVQTPARIDNRFIQRPSSYHPYLSGHSTFNNSNNINSNNNSTSGVVLQADSRPFARYPTIAPNVRGLMPTTTTNYGSMPRDQEQWRYMNLIRYNSNYNNNSPSLIAEEGAQAAMAVGSSSSTPNMNKNKKEELDLTLHL